MINEQDRLNLEMQSISQQQRELLAARIERRRLMRQQEIETYGQVDKENEKVFAREIEEMLQ